MPLRFAVAAKLSTFAGFVDQPLSGNPIIGRKSSVSERPSIWASSQLRNSSGIFFKGEKVAPATGTGARGLSYMVKEFKIHIAVIGLRQRIGHFFNCHFGN